MSQASYPGQTKAVSFGHFQQKETLLILKKWLQELVDEMQMWRKQKTTTQVAPRSF